MTDAGRPACRQAGIAVVGAGAAGLMTAIAAARARPSAHVLLIDTRRKIGAKILMSGGTRCNVTNVSVKPSDYEGGPRHFVQHVLEAFTPQETRDFFAALGVELVLEPTGKYFPATNSGKTVLDALMKEASRLGVALEPGRRVTRVDKPSRRLAGAAEMFRLTLESDEGSSHVEARRVVLCTGGLSYPETGSDGTGYQVAGALGHSLVPTRPALTPLRTADPDWPLLSGVTLDLRLSFYRDGKKSAERAGSFLFTHDGFSGPAALDISRFVASAPSGSKPEVRASFLPKDTAVVCRARLDRALQKKAKNFLVDEGLPASLAAVLLKKAGLDPDAPLRTLKDRDRGRLVHALFETPLSVEGVVGYKKAEVTAGGIPLKEVRVATMESRLVPGLYFAGEILDCDGRIGGFNFQWAWSTGTIAGRAAAGSLP